MTYKRVDNNQAAIVEALRDMGVTVKDLSAVGKGMPDKIIGFQGQTHLVEIKNPEAKQAGGIGWKYTDAQKKFHAEWCGSPILTFESVDDALLWIQSIA